MQHSYSGLLVDWIGLVFFASFLSLIKYHNMRKCVSLPYNKLCGWCTV